MSRRVVGALGAGLVVLLVSASPATAIGEDSATLEPFGRVELYREGTRPARVVLLLSGAHGWNRGAVEIARAIASLDALVIGIDLPRYLATVSSWGRYEIYPSADLELLSQFVQKKSRLPAYVPPVVVGYADAAAMAYAIAAQTRPATFAGAISLGFCPTVTTPTPLGRGTNLTWTRAAQDPPSTYVLTPAVALATSWVAFQGREAHGCDPSTVRRFVDAVPGAALVEVAATERVLADPEMWLPSLGRTLDRLTGARVPTPVAPGDLGDLPLIEVPARTAPIGALAVILSGDGGWASLDREVGGVLADAGVGVVGVNSLAYFWTARTPDGAAVDLARVLRHYRDAWHASRLLLIGYSRGADVLPFLASRLPADLRADIALVALLGPGLTTDFEFHLTDWIGGDEPGAKPIRPEIDRLRGVHVLCVQGDAEDDSLCPELDAGLATRMVLAGGHHFGGDYALIAARILTDAGLGADGRPPSPQPQSSPAGSAR